MANTFININLHIIFHTKRASCIMREDDLPQVFRYVVGTIQTASGCAIKVGGRPDHLHILTSLPINMTLPDFVRTIKANTSRWIKKQGPYYDSFAWQSGYGAFSVSESNKEAVVNYISNQKEHHMKHSAQEEFRAFLEKHGISINDRFYHSHGCEEE